LLQHVFTTYACELVCIAIFEVLCDKTKFNRTRDCQYDIKTFLVGITEQIMELITESKGSKSSLITGYNDIKGDLNLLKATKGKHELSDERRDPKRQRI